MSERKILITGATGATGGYAAECLLEMKIPVRALVRQIDERSDRLAARGIEVVQGDLLNYESVVSALKGISAAYFVYSIKVPGLIEATAMFAQAAIEQKVEAIANMSQITARREAPSKASLAHWIAERLFDRSGVPVTHLRPTLFAEWPTYFARAIKERSILPLPFGEAKYAPIAAEDQGRAIAAILANPAAHAGKSYSLFGLKELSQYDTAAILSAALGREIKYVPMDIEAFDQLLSQMGFNAHFRQHVGAIARDAHDGVFSGMNDQIARLTGRPPMGMPEYIQKNKTLFQ